LPPANGPTKLIKIDIKTYRRDRRSHALDKCGKIRRF